MSSGWEFVAHAAGLWSGDRSAEKPIAVEDQQQALARLAADGHEITIVDLATEAGRKIRGVVVAPVPGDFRRASQPCAAVVCPSESGAAPIPEALPLTEMLLKLQIYVMVLDISSSHAFCEASDVGAAVRKLRESDFRRTLGWLVGQKETDELPTTLLCGRSAGANAALSYAASDPLVGGLICDSAYSDLPSLFGLPSWMASPFAGLKRIAEDLPELTCGSKPAGPHGAAGAQATSYLPPWEIASKLWMPALYVHGQLDRQVPPSCARALRDRHAGESQLLLVHEGTHDSKRPEHLLAHMAIFAHRAMQRPIAEAEQLAGPLQELRTLAVSRRDPGLAAQDAPEEEHFPTVGASEKDTERNLLRFVLRSCKGGLENLNFEWFPLPTPEPPTGADAGASAALLRHNATFLLPSSESEVTLAWALTTSCGVGGTVYFVTVTHRLLTITEADAPVNGKLLEKGYKTYVKQILSRQVPLGFGGKTHSATLTVERGGKIQVQVNASAAYVMGKPAIHHGTLVLWRASARSGSWGIAAPHVQQVRPAPLNLAALGCAGDSPTGYEASMTSTLLLPHTVNGPHSAQDPGYSLVSGISSISPMSRRHISRPNGSLTVSSVNSLAPSGISELSPFRGRAGRGSGCTPQSVAAVSKELPRFGEHAAEVAAAAANNAPAVCPGGLPSVPAGGTLDSSSSSSSADNPALPTGYSFGVGLGGAAAELRKPSPACSDDGADEAVSSMVSASHRGRPAAAADQAGAEGALLIAAAGESLTDDGMGPQSVTWPGCQEKAFDPSATWQVGDRDLR
mmetsp:Transcript_67127/g.187832  ORF Transcript_67127/g.187832 Transcript_67127/m.187832 type:complete len:798 (+) Transcript_67127:46-2439(+)